jgi:pyruvate dehydrogenase E2 component (dihydrolipoamide acetyltransferase)
MGKATLQEPKPDAKGTGAGVNGESTRIPLTMIQKTAARRMLQSAREVPQFSVSMDLDAGELADLRKQINADNADEEKRVSFTALLIWLTAKALRKHPRVNGRFDEDAILQFDFVNVAIAVDTPNGLTVPVIHGADTLSVYEIAVALREKVGKAAARRLRLGDFADPTITISNLGMLGVSRFTPLINPPQAAIIGIGAPMKGVLMNDDGSLRSVQTIDLTVTGDHRILDGAEVSRFLQTVRMSVKEVTEMEGWKEKSQNTNLEKMIND